MNIKLENLEIDGYSIYQDKDTFNFGIDAVLLSNFVLREGIKKTYKNQNSFKICDLCTGTLPIPLIIYAKYKKVINDAYNISINHMPHIDAFEIDEDQVSLCKKSIMWNEENVDSAKYISKDINVFNDDIKNIITDKNKYSKLYETYDIVTVNPPYTKKGSGLLNLSDKKIIARHEISITFDDICKVASLILKSNKKFCFIHKSSRFTELVSTLKKNSFALKKVAFIYPYIDKESNLFIGEAVKNAKDGVKILEPIVIYEEPLKYTKKVLEIYGK